MPVGVMCMVLDRGKPVPVGAMVFVVLGRRVLWPGQGIVVVMVFRSGVLGPGVGVVGVVLGWGAPVLVRVGMLSWGGGFMVGMVWEGRREDGEEQQSSDDSCGLGDRV